MTEHQDLVDPVEVTVDPVARALIIEDTRDFAEILKRALAAINIESRIETSGVDGVNTFYELNPDLILLDIGLPDVKRHCKAAVIERQEAGSSKQQAAKPNRQPSITLPR